LTNQKTLIYNHSKCQNYFNSLHGNVKEVIQDVPIDSLPTNNISTQYEYELISGNMKKVSYQKEKIDQITHEYKYDNLNRLTDVLSSIDDIHYHREASYTYYDYGPLARKEIGSQRVQGQDFTYTINGWLKGMNSNTLDKTKDPGKDGTSYPTGTFASRNQRVAKDVVGFSLGYYSGDYSPIGGNPAEAAYSETNFGNGSSNLYNGNIRHMVTAIEGLDIQGYAYKYDQLQRIKEMQVYRASDVQSTFSWANSTPTDDYKTTFSYDRNGNLSTLNRNGFGSELDMDRFEYNYHTIGGERSNRLDYVTDNGTDYSSYDDIKSGQNSGNYTYNKIGELTGDAQENMILHWRTGDHKLARIERTDENSSELEFVYSPFGQRVMKIEKIRANGVFTGEVKNSFYAYDANGQVMAIYELDQNSAYKLKERYLYGAERLGANNAEVTIFENNTLTEFIHKETNVVHVDERGRKRYELVGHTNSVLAVISDRKLYNELDGNYEPVMISWSDYYAFGMTQSGRNGSATSELYRYQFQSMETDREVSGNGNSYTTEFRQYDPRLGRWKSLDALMHMFPHVSPYVAFANNPVYFTDIYGLAPDGGDDDDGDGGGNGNGEFTRNTDKKEIQLYERQQCDDCPENSKPSTVNEYSFKFEVIQGRNKKTGQIEPVVVKDNFIDKGAYTINDGQGKEYFKINVKHQTYWSPFNSDSYWTETTIISDNYLDAMRAAWMLANPGCIWCDDAQLSLEESAILGNAVLLFGSLRSPNSFMKNTEYTQKVKIQMKQSDNHGFPLSVDKFASYGKVSTITGGDGVTRLRLSIPGVYKGKKGNFVYIKEADGKINHRQFELN
jgi:RHS repeat-associated protein